MYFYVLFSLCCSVVNALPQSSQSINLDNPSDADPTIPPSSLVPRPRPTENPFAAGIPQLPAECTDASHPSDDCQKAMVAQEGDLHAFGGYLKHDGSCIGDRESQLETALWDACTLAVYASSWPHDLRGQQAGHYYMGPDYVQFQDRIKKNIARAADFRLTSKNYITVSCDDKKKQLCSTVVDGKSVGGYAWTDKLWYGTYYYITLCNIFFTLDTLDQKFQQIEQELQSGQTDHAKDANWLKTTGQFFLHEMMHLDIIGQPHIGDEYVQNDGVGPRAYGPYRVRQLAQRALKSGGGATRASTNADSYAWLVNTIYWWDTTEYFPGVPGKPQPLQQGGTETGGVAGRDSSTGSRRDGEIIMVDLGLLDASIDDAALSLLFNQTLKSYADDAGSDPKDPINGI